MLLRFSLVSRVNRVWPCTTSGWLFSKCPLVTVWTPNAPTAGPLRSAVASLHLLIVSGHVFPGFVGFCAREEIIAVLACLPTTLEITLDVVSVGQF